MRRTRWAAACATALAAALAGGSLPAAADQAPAFADPALSPGAGGGTRTVTLLTGDVVTYSGSGNAVQISSIVPGSGREGMGFTRFRADGHEYAVPIDAVGQISQGRVDQRLFDVTELVASGYSDSSTDTLRVLVGGATPSAGSPDAPKGARVAAAFRTTGTTALTVPKKSAGTVWKQLGTASVPAPKASGRSGWTAGCGPRSTRPCRRSARTRRTGPGSPGRAPRSRCSTPATTVTTPI